MSAAKPAPRRDFLFELGTEELPPKTLPALEQALREGVGARLDAAGLQHGALESFATPRRLAVRVRRLADQQPAQEIRRRGPPLRAAFDAAGAPTRAAQAFASSCGVDLEALGRERDDKGNEYLWFSGTKPGATTLSLLPDIVSETLAALPIPKRMRWGEGEAQFVRPAHWLVCLYGSEVVPTTLLGLHAGRTTRGHRFHAPREITLRAPAGYERSLLTRGFVVASFAARRERVREQVSSAAAALGGSAVMSAALLDEVTALVEWPMPVTGRFEERFLALPREVLIATLQEHQRYFAVAAPDGALLPWFITVANIDSRDSAVVRAGNERVVRPRLADAAFFWDQDRRAPLIDRRAELVRVTYQAQLGSVAQKAERVGLLAQHLAPLLGASEERVIRAALLCKCDLLTTMVGEFPELQGVMGTYYARLDGEDSEVASAIAEHYLPRHAGDALPVSPTGLALALADRVDTLAGVFVIGQKPSGTRDPFGLRRATIGVLRIALEKNLNFNLRTLIEQVVTLNTAAALASAGTATPSGTAAPSGSAPVPGTALVSGTTPVAGALEIVTAQIYAFVMERLRALYLEGERLQGVTTEMFDAVLDSAPASIPDFDQRLRALVRFLAAPEAASLTAANKRIANILKKSASAVAAVVEPQLLREPAEQALHLALNTSRPPIEAALERRDYAAAFTALAALRPSIDAFFDGVMVNDPDERLRTNRLNLLAALRALFTRVADLSRLPG